MNPLIDEYGSHTQTMQRRPSVYVLNVGGVGEDGETIIV